jgi:hypothetical protein
MPEFGPFFLSLSRVEKVTDEDMAKAICIMVAAESDAAVTGEG